MAKIFIYGILPPPYGGVSIYNKRLIYYLAKRDVDFVFCQSNPVPKKENKKKPFWKLVSDNLNFTQKVIHISGFGSYKNHIIFLCLMVLFRKKIIVTIHNDRFAKDFAALCMRKKVVAYLFYKSISRLIAVNRNSNFLFVNRQKIVYIPAFMPPVAEELLSGRLPKIFHDIRKKHTFLITANAFRISFHNNEDLYGIDLSIELMKRLKIKGYSDVGFIYVIPEIGDHEYYQKMQELVLKHKITDHFHFYTQPVPYPAVINLCDLFIRPTNTDGDAISLREALSLKKPSIASDAVLRPEGTLLFENRNISDLENKTEDIINNYDIHKNRIRDVSYEDNAQKIIEIYNKVLHP